MLAVAMLLGIVPAAVAQIADAAHDAWTQCKSRLPEVVIAGCSAIIGRNGESTTDVAAAFNNRAVAYSRIGKYQMAISDFDQAIGLKSNYIELAGDSALSLVVSSAENNGLLGDDSYSERSPDAALFYKNRGVAYYSMGKYARAAQDFTQAMALRHNYLEAMLDRGTAYADALQFDNAIEDYNAVIEIKSNDPAAFVDRGALYARQEKYDLAIADFNHAIELRPGYASAFSNRCFAHAIQGQLQVALADCNIALDINPRLISALDSRGFTYLKLGQYEQARADYSASLKVSAQDSNALYGRGLAEQMTGDGAAAEADIAAARQLRSGIEDDFARWGISAMHVEKQTSGSQNGSR